MDLDAIVGDVLEEPRTITKVRSRNVSNSLLANYALRNACHPSLLLFNEYSYLVSIFLCVLQEKCDGIRQPGYWECFVTCIST